MRQWLDLTGEIVLRCLDDKSGLSWDDLILELGLRDVPPGGMALINCLSDLFKSGLIIVPEIDFSNKNRIRRFFGVADSPDYFKLALSLCNENRNIKIRTAPKWLKIRRTLSMPYLGGARNSGNFSMVVRPVFGDPGAPAKHSDIFVLMPFDCSMTHIYADHITKVAASLNLSVMRADDIFRPNMIMADVWSMIAGSAIVIADLTDKNPNVFYELGIAHTVGKPAIIISQNIEFVPFDLRHFRVITYTFDSSGMKIFEERLGSALSETLKLNT